MLLKSLVSLAVLSSALIACSSVADPVDTESADLSTDDAIARGEEWVAAKLHYCQAANHQRDYDAACASTCTRTDNASWDPYRSDCSGFVSWSWGLPAPGRVTGELAPFQTDITKAISAIDLQEGDAVNNSDHIMLFKEWTTPGKVAVFLEEPGCSSSTPYAHQVSSNVTINGTSIFVAYNGMTFTAIRYGKLTPPVADAPTKGALEGASCTSIAGYAQDPDVATKSIDVDLYFDAPKGGAGSLGPLHLTAGGARPDLTTKLGSANHGFNLGAPLAVMDGAAHTIYAYGIDSAGTAADDTLLTGSPKSITCAVPAMPATSVQGVKRWITSATILGAWKLGGDARLQIAHEPAATVNALASGPDLPATPDVIQADDGTPDIWVVDGTSRRRVPNPQSMIAWAFGTPVKTAAAKVTAMTQGPDFPESPFVFMGDGAPQVYVLDSAPGQPPLTGGGSNVNGNTPGTSTMGSATPDDPQGPDATGATPDPTAANATPSQGSGGCALSRGDTKSAAPFAWMIVLAFIGSMAMRRRLQ